MRVVVDTNVLISSLLNGAVGRTIFRSFKNGEFDILLSKNLLDEMVSVLNRPKFRSLIDPLESKDTLAFLKSRAFFVEPKSTIDVCRDPEDNKILETAVEGKADFIVTGDQDLLVFKFFRGIPVITPKEFLKWIKK